jgi:hypothetical protein
MSKDFDSAAARGLPSERLQQRTLRFDGATNTLRPVRGDANPERTCGRGTSVIGTGRPDPAREERHLCTRDIKSKTKSCRDARAFRVAARARGAATGIAGRTSRAVARRCRPRRVLNDEPRHQGASVVLGENRPANADEPGYAHRVLRIVEAGDWASLDRITRVSSRTWSSTSPKGTRASLLI